MGRVARTLTVFRRYQNPLHILRKRLLGKPYDSVTIIDRESGIRCVAPVGAFHMFATSWYLRDYDVPHMAIRDGDTVVDIGANHGFFTCYAARKGARVYAFEPNPRIFEQLEKNIAMNQLQDRVVARPWAISDGCGEAELLISEGLAGGMSTIAPEFARNFQGGGIAGRARVPTYTLSRVIEIFALEQVRLCKIDAEGSEVAILGGLLERDRTRLESLVLEYHPESYPLAKLLSLLLSWKTHQVSFMEEKQYSGNVLRAVLNEALLQLSS
jgi:FkbM family methyltransferase